MSASDVIVNITKNIPEAKIEGENFPLKVTLDGYIFEIDEKGNVELVGPTPIISNVKLVNSAGIEEAEKPEEGTSGYFASFKVSLTEEGIINSVTFNSTEIAEDKGLYKIPVTANEEYKVEVNFTVDGTTYIKEAIIEIKDLFKIVEPIEASDIATNSDTFKKVTQGKVLNYGTTMGIDWKVFYAEGEEIYLIASDRLPVSKLTTQKANLGFQDDGAYDIFWKGKDDFKVTSINSAVINKFKLSKEATFTKSNVNYKLTSCLLDATKWDTFRDIEWADENNVIGSPTLEMWVASWNKKYPNDKLYCDKADTSGYYIGSSSNPGTDCINLSSKNGYQDSLYYPQRWGSSTYGGYWLASPSCWASTANLVTMYNGFIYYGQYS